LAGGCICCSALVAFRAAVVALLRRRPARLLIEPTGLAGLGAVRALLAEPGIAPSVRVDPLLVLIHPSQWANAAIRAFPVYQEQLEAADVIGITHADSAAPADLARLRADLVATPHFDITDGQLDASALARAAASRRLRLRPLLDDPDTADPAVDGRGWIWPSTAIADLARLETALLADPTARCAWRCKGILRAADGWYEIHLADGRLQRSPRGPHSDARLEMLHPRATATQPPPDWARVAEILAECIAEER
jgi:G3E family GTPase